MVTLLILAAILVGQLLVWAVVLALLARRSSSLGATLGRAFAAGVLCTAFNLAVTWLLNPSAPGLEPIAVLVRSLLIVALVMLGDVRIVQFLLRVSYGRAWFLWVVSIVASSTLGFAAVALLVKPYLVEAFVTSSNSMAPTLVGWHRENVCPFCGGTRIMTTPEPNSPEARFMEPDRIGICVKCRKIAEVEETADALRILPVETPDRFLVNKRLEPRRWDMIVFRPPHHPDAKYVSRLVGLPGETVFLKDGGLWIDGVRIEPPGHLAGLEYDAKLDGRLQQFGDKASPWKLGPGECVVLGDNREHSADSRMWGLLPTTNIESVVALTYWPPSRWTIHR